MKIQYISIRLLFVLFISGIISAAHAQTDKQIAIRNLIESKHFVFKAETALPLTGMTVQLTSPYDLTIHRDSLISYLPYYGRAYNIDYGTADAGLKFTSTNFNYKITNRKKGGWDIAITPKDARDIREIYLTISETGYGSLQVVSNNRQAISFTGYIAAK